jgi:putative glutamine amidotransferase
MKTPIIGITSYVEQVRWSVWDARAALVPYSFVELVTMAGGRGVVLPPHGGAAVMARLDGLILVGGADVEPARYGQRPHPETVSRPERDEGELLLLAAALAAGMPVLGVCRGAQLLAVAHGGRLHQHLPDLLGHEKHQPGPGTLGSHPARFAPGSHAARIFGPTMEVNSYHHQGIDDPGRLTVTGWAEDGVIEAVEARPAAAAAAAPAPGAARRQTRRAGSVAPERPFVLGLQWHPEEARDPRPFAALVAAAARYATGARPRFRTRLGRSRGTGVG